MKLPGSPRKLRKVARAHSKRERWQVERYLAHKYGLSIAVEA